MNIINQVNSENYQPFIKKVLKHCYKTLRISKKKAINIILVDNATIKQMNATYRDKDAVTDVLTFPSSEPGELGDVFIALHMVFNQAQEYGHSFKRELAFLTVHGFLHAIGYDHDTEENEQAMFSLQHSLLNGLKIFR